MGLLLVVALAFYAPINFGGQKLVGNDTVQWRSMAESMLEYRAETGEEPLWATHPFGGMPGYMINYSTIVWQADDLIRPLNRILWPTVQLLVLLFGVYVLLFYLTRDHWAGVLAACAFGLSTYIPIILGVGHNSKFVAMGYAPWLILAFVHIMRKPSILAGLFGAVALAVNVRAGHPQITYYVLMLLLIWWIAEGIGAVRSGQGKKFGWSTLYLLGGLGLSLLMVAQPYLAQFEYKAYTIRGATSGGEAGAGSLDWGYAMEWSQGWQELWTLFIANASGGGSGSGAYWGPKIFTEGPYYLGGVVIALAVWAIWWGKNRMVWALGIAAGLMIIFALGEHASFINRPMFDYFPLFGSFRAPEMWLAVGQLVLAILAGYGVYLLGRKATEPTQEASKTRAALLSFGGITALALIFWLGGTSMFSFERPGEVRQIAAQVAAAQQPPMAASDPQVQAAARQYQEGLKTERADLFSADAGRTFIFLLLALALVWLARQGRIPAWGMQLGLVLLVIIDLWGVGKRYFGPEKLTERALEESIPTYSADTYIKQQAEALGGDGHFRVLSFERNPIQNARPAYHYEYLGGYHGAKLRLYQDYIDHLLFEPNGLPNENALDLTGTRYIVSPQPLPGTQVVHQDEQRNLYVLERVNARPRNVLVGQVEVVPEAEATWARLREVGFDSRQTALLPAALELPVTPIDSTSTATVTLETYTARDIAWAVETDAPRLLVTSEVYYPAGWRAYIDGAETSILRVNHLFRGVVAPAGTHRITMRFDPESHTQGLWIAGTSTALVYGLTIMFLGLGWWRKRNKI